jgi:hypothetical protein
MEKEASCTMIRQMLQSTRFEFSELRDALRFKEFEGEGWDYFLLPGHILSWFAALIWSWLYYPVSRLNWWFRNHCWPVFWVTRWVLPLGGGRWEDPNPTICSRCLWMGARRAAVHTYASCGEDDVEAVDECPRCGNEI